MKLKRYWKFRYKGTFRWIDPRSQIKTFRIMQFETTFIILRVINSFILNK